MFRWSEYGVRYLVQLNNAGMSDEFEDVDLSGYSFHIGDIDDFLFHEYFYRNLLPCESMSGQFNFSESALTDGFT